MQSVLLVLCFAAFIAVQPGTAQETIFNVPSGDILDKWKVYGEFDFGYLWDASSGTYTPRLVAGVGHKIEIGINLNGVTSPGPSQTAPTPRCRMGLPHARASGLRVKIKINAEEGGGGIFPSVYSIPSNRERGEAKRCSTIFRVVKMPHPAHLRAG